MVTANDICGSKEWAQTHFGDAISTDIRRHKQL